MFLLLLITINIDVFLSCVYQVSAQLDLKSCWKLASIRLFKFGCICDAAATEELRSEVHLRTQPTCFNVLYQGYLINF